MAETPETTANENVYHIPGSERVGTQFEDGDTLDFHTSQLERPEVTSARHDIEAVFGERTVASVVAAPEITSEQTPKKEVSEPELVSQVARVLGDNIKYLRDEELGKAA